MGTTCSSVQTDYKAYKKYPNILQEFKSGNNFLKNLFRVEFQFYGDFEEVWKILDKANHNTYSLHERKKSDLIENKSYYSYVARENRIVVKLSNHFIQKVHFAFQQETSLYIVTDYISGRLSHYIKKKHQFTNSQLQYIVASLILGLEYLRSKNIIHRDLRPENIFLSSEGKVKIGGFLFARENSSIDNFKDFIGNVGYIAPEVIEKKQYS